MRPPRRSSTAPARLKPAVFSRANSLSEKTKVKEEDTMLRRHFMTVAVLGLGLLSHLPFVQAQDKSIVVASTTSTQDSGLFGHILPLFKAKTGIDVKVIAQGTGQALDTARRGDADVVFVHAKAQEEKFVAEGFGVKRFDVMYNDFVLIGPKADPAKVKGNNDVVAALKAINAAGAPFVSRGDKSGTHAAELALWKAAALDPAAAKPAWYREIGQGMGAALNTASAMGAYLLADRGTWISFKNKGDLEIAVEGDKRLFNQYGVVLVNPEKHPTVKKQEGQAFIDWVLSAEGQTAIGAYKIEGQQLFFPNGAATQ
jgi:tungstate transport system substrate-binding protein